MLLVHILHLQFTYIPVIFEKPYNNGNFLCIFFGFTREKDEIKKAIIYSFHIQFETEF